jgi:biopolymer transport protein ExbD
MNLSRGSESQGINEPEINVVSLIDVVLLLVVFFMVSSTFVEEGRIKVQLPQASSVPVNQTVVDPIVVTVTAQGAYRVNERGLINNSPETLRAAVLRLAGERRKVPITIRADARATHQSVVTAMDVVGRLGFSQINIATLNEQGGGAP